MSRIPAAPFVAPPRKKPALKQKLAVWARWLHIYSSLFGLGVILFFSVTGLTLNHPDWAFGSVRHEQLHEGSVPLEWVQTGEAEVARLEIVEHLRREHGVRGFLDTFTQDEGECLVAFKGPAYSADAFVDRRRGTYELAIVTDGWVAVMNDLHKGRNTGPVWSWVIDISAVLLIVVSATGLVLLLYIKRRRNPGLILAAVGAVIALVVIWTVIV